MGRLTRRMRINRGDRKHAFTGATSGAVVGGASGAGVGAVIGLAMIPIAPVSVPVGIVVGGLIGSICGAPSGAAVAVKRGRNSSIEELNVHDAARYGDGTGDMLRLRGDTELADQAEDRSTYATAPLDQNGYGNATSYGGYAKQGRSKDDIPEEEGEFNAWSAPMALSTPATTPSYSYGHSSSSASSSSKTKTSSTTTTSSYGYGSYGNQGTYHQSDEDPAERLLRTKTGPKPSSSSSQGSSYYGHGGQSNRGRKYEEKEELHNDEEEGSDEEEDEGMLAHRGRGGGLEGGQSGQRGNLVPVLPPLPATDVHLRHVYDPQEEFSSRYEGWEQREARERERQKREMERKDEEYARELQRQFDREQATGGGGGRRTTTNRKTATSEEVDPSKTLDSLWGSEPFY